jgi:hypothetical protein
MLALSVSILPISSIHCLAPLSSRTIIRSPACAGFALTGVRARDLQFPFRGRPPLAKRRQSAPSSLGFELTPSRTNSLLPVFRESRFSNLESYCVGRFFRESRQDAQRPNEMPKSPRMRTYTKRGEGGAGLFRVQSTSFFVSLERRCHNGLLRGPRSIYLQTSRQRRRHGQS